MLKIQIIFLALIVFARVGVAQVNDASPQVPVTARWALDGGRSQATEVLRCWQRSPSGLKPGGEVK